MIAGISLVIVVIIAIDTTITAFDPREAVRHEAGQKLPLTARSMPAVVGRRYHDSIVDKSFAAKHEFDRTVAPEPIPRRGRQTHR